MDILRELEVGAEQRWMANVLIELRAIRKLLEKLMGQEGLLVGRWEAKSESYANVVERRSPYEYEEAAAVGSVILDRDTSGR